MLTLALIAAALLVAFANGGNDNAKGVATLIGSRILEFRSAIRLANGATLLGALTAIPMALYVNSTLIKAFGGAGLLPKGFPVDAHYLLAVGFGAACTLLIATRLGFPISTTHSLIGALVGAGFIAVGPQRLVWIALGSKFVLPLLLSPILAAAFALILYPVFRRLLAATGGQKLCLCVEQTYMPVVSRGGVLTLATSGRALSVAEIARCERVATEKLLAFSADEFVKAGQFMTSSLVSFARGLNDTPKIAGILVAAGTLGLTPRIFGVGPVIGSVALAMLLGGALAARRVGRTMSENITAMDKEQGFVASLVTALLVLLASFAGLPVSTTHVAVGSLFGIGLLNRTARLDTLSAILIAWVVTLPVAALLAAVGYLILKTIIMRT